MLKQLAALFLLAAFVAQTFTGSLICLDYFANTSAYAKNCVNKARPKMRCNGKCQMMKKMQEEEKKEQENTERKFENKITVLFSKSFFYTPENRFSILISNKATAFEKAYPTKDMSYAFFHPPQG